MESDYQLIEPVTPPDWEFVHTLRDTELFAPREITYNSDHPANTAPGRFTYILMYKNTPIATASLDLLENNTGVVRVVAVTKEEQRKGHGRILQDLFEKAAKEKHLTKLFVNANKTATAFY